MQALKHTQPLTTYDTYQADILELRENLRDARIDSNYMFIKHILRENSPSGRINSNYIIL